MELSFSKTELEQLYQRHIKNNSSLIGEPCLCKSENGFKSRLSYLWQKAACIAAQKYRELLYSDNPEMFNEDFKLIKNLKCQAKEEKKRLIHREKEEMKRNPTLYKQFEISPISMINIRYEQHDVWGSRIFISSNDKKILTPKEVYCYCCDSCYEKRKVENEINKALQRPIENLLREFEGLPKIGEGWASEVSLRNIINEILIPYNLTSTFHYRPIFLKGKEIDIYFEIDGKKIGIEYQGKQHYEPIDFFGGKEGFEKLRKRDLEKKLLCKKNNIKLVEVSYVDKLTYPNIVNILRNVNILPKTYSIN